MAEEEELGDLIFDIVTNIDEMKNQLGEVNKAAKETAKNTSIVGVATRRGFLQMINSSVIAGTVMQDFNDIVGLLADEIFEVLLPAIEPIIEFLYGLVDAFAALDDKHKLVVAAIVAVAAAFWLISTHPIVGTIAIIAGLLILAEKRFGLLTKAGEFLSENWKAIVTIAFPLVGLLMELEERFGLVTTVVNTTISLFKILAPIARSVLGVGITILTKAVGGLVDIFQALDHILFGGSVIPHLKMMVDIIKVALIPSLTVLRISLDAINFVLGKMDAFIGNINRGFGSIKNITNNITQYNQFFGGGGAAGPLAPAQNVSSQLRSLVGV